MKISTAQKDYITHKSQLLSFKPQSLVVALYCQCQPQDSITHNASGDIILESERCVTTGTDGGSNMAAAAPKLVSDGSTPPTGKKAVIPMEKTPAIDEEYDDPGDVDVISEPDLTAA
ncbi:hypothetical protein Q8A73_012418 [Channa argus]|nr:hypothetical protein Q8A73_012418 [Channa argus]